MAVAAVRNSEPLDLPIFEAAIAGDLATIKKFIDLGGWIHQPDREGNSMIYLAARQGRVEVVRYLRDQGASLYANNEGNLSIKNVPSAVKETLKSMKNESRDLSALIAERLDSMSEEEAIAFLRSLPPSRARDRVLAPTIRDCVLKNPHEALSLPDRFPEEMKSIVVQSIIRGHLSYGDINSAQECLDRFLSSDPHYRSFQDEITLFSDFYSEMEGQVSSEKLKDFVENELGLIELNESPKFGFSPDTLSELMKALSNCSSLAKLYAYVKTIHDPNLQYFLRVALSFYDSAMRETLEEFSQRTVRHPEGYTTDHSAMLIDQYFEVGEEPEEYMTDYFAMLIDQYFETGDATAVASFIRSIKDREVRHRHFMMLGCGMCKKGHYTEAYEIVKTEREYAKTVDTKEDSFYSTSLMELLGILVEEYVETEWYNKFSDLRLPE